jgi:hypothetical protein
MQPKTAAATDGTIAHRPWYRLHVSTWVVGLVMVGFFGTLNLSIEERCEYRAAIVAPAYTFHAGWPYRFWSWNLPSQFSDDDSSQIFQALDHWFLFDRETPVKWHIALANVFVALSVAIVLMSGCELWRRRRGRIWQLRLVDLLVTTMLLAAVFAWLRTKQNEARFATQQQQHLPALVAAFEVDRPRALWRLLALDKRLTHKHVISFATGFNPGAIDEPARLNDFDLKRLSSFEYLRFLSASHRDHSSGPWPVVIITDAGLEHLGQLKNLEYLSLPDHPGITDAGLPRLAKLKRLKFLNLRGTGVTPLGVAALRRQLPRATIEGP